eukprot:GHRR01029036.1.p1 GENE.GHRR01029036.1~~GHRR01029036.1.p1  ORF type:complete len:413 (+),score=108.05 GHRR01029036.1:175-1413(+)
MQALQQRHGACQLHQRHLGHRRRLSPTCHAVQVADPCIGQLISWASSNKVSVEKLQVANDLATDTAVLVAAREMSSGDAILSVPDTAWVTPGLAQSSAIGKHIAQLEPWLQLALLLLVEKANPGSKLQQYISSLPSQPNSPLFWSDDELQLLQGTQLLESILGYKQFFLERFQQLDQELFSPNRAAFPLEQFSYNNFAWAVASVRSKLHAPLDVDPVALVPLADALPHRRSANATWKVKSAGLFGKNKVLAVEATRIVRKGEAIAMDYGPVKLDNTLLLDHGVLDSTNSKGGYNLTLTLPEEDRYYADKLDILERNSLAASSSFTLIRGQDPPEEMIGFLRLMQLGGQQGTLPLDIGMCCTSVYPGGSATPHMPKWFCRHSLDGGQAHVTAIMGWHCGFIFVLLPRMGHARI